MSSISDNGLFRCTKSIQNAITVLITLTVLTQYEPRPSRNAVNVGQTLRAEHWHFGWQSHPTYNVNQHQCTTWKTSKRRLNALSQKQRQHYNLTRRNNKMQQRTRTQSTRKLYGWETLWDYRSSTETKVHSDSTNAACCDAPNTFDWCGPTDQLPTATKCKFKITDISKIHRMNTAANRQNSDTIQ